MSKIDGLVEDFLAQKKIAVVGVSDKRARRAATWATVNSKRRDILSAPSTRA